MVSVLRRRTNSDVSDLASVKPMESRKVVNQLYYARGACLSPYKDLLRKHTMSGREVSTNPGG